MTPRDPLQMKLLLASMTVSTTGYVHTCAFRNHRVQSAEVTGTILPRRTTLFPIFSCRVLVSYHQTFHVKHMSHASMSFHSPTCNGIELCGSGSPETNTRIKVIPSCGSGTLIPVYLSLSSSKQNISVLLLDPLSSLTEL